jgi:hypothetical protein
MHEIILQSRLPLRGCFSQDKATAHISPSINLDLNRINCTDYLSGTLPKHF